MFKEKINPSEERKEQEIKKFREIAESQLSKIKISPNEMIMLFDKLFCDLPENEIIKQRNHLGEVSADHELKKEEFNQLEKIEYVKNLLQRIELDFKSINPQSAITSLKRFPQLLALPQANDLAQAIEIIEKLQEEE